MRLAMAVNADLSCSTSEPYSYSLPFLIPRAFRCGERNEIVKNDRTGLAWMVSGVSSQIGVNAVGLSRRDNMDALNCLPALLPGCARLGRALSGRLCGFLLQHMDAAEDIDALLSGPENSKRRVFRGRDQAGAAGKLSFCAYLSAYSAQSSALPLWRDADQGGRGFLHDVGLAALW
jgi:hypothetical protein